MLDSGLPDRAQDLGAVADLVVGEHGASPAAVVAASLGQSRGIGAAGRLTRDGDAEPVQTETPFDLASVTKPMVALTMARLVRAGTLALNEPLGDLVPWLADTASGRTPLALFASHRAGLEAHIRLFEPLVTGGEVEPRAAARIAADSRRAECAGVAPSDGFAPVYSDMGYLLVGLALETRAGLALDALVAREVLEPLGLRDRIGSARQLDDAHGGLVARVAPTEDVAWRGGLIRGVVHDENAFALSADRISGHAGLFGDAGAVLTVGEAILAALAGDTSWLGPNDLAPLVRPRPGGSLLMGFDARTGEAPSSGSRLGPRTFGHLGFTGTSLWIDPDCRFVGVLLTNRVHPTREHIAIRRARPAAYDAMFDALQRDR